LASTIDAAPAWRLRVGPLNLLGLRTFLASDNVKNDLVTLAKGFETFSEYSGVMNEDVLSRLLGNETQAFLVVPPFNFAFSHNYLLNAFDSPEHLTGHTPDRHLGARRFVPSDAVARLSEAVEVSQVVFASLDAASLPGFLEGVVAQPPWLWPRQPIQSGATIGDLCAALHHAFRD
jgi:hypothetical protein